MEALNLTRLGWVGTVPGRFEVAMRVGAVGAARKRGTVGWDESWGKRNKMAKVPFTVVLSDAGEHDEGVRGTRLFWWFASNFFAYAELGLFWFLRTYHGSEAVQLLRPSQLLDGNTRTTRWLFVGLPTRVNHQHLQKIRFDHLVLYDSTDFHGINFDYSNREFLLSHTNICLKNWRDARWNYPFHVGLLPIKRPPINKLQLALMRESWRAAGRSASRLKRYDVGFVARPTGDLNQNPRVRWLLELRQSRPDIRLWGGLVGGKSWRKRVKLDQQQELLDSLWLNRRKIGYFEYFAGLSQSKVALAPRGFAPWTYRHYEAIYARTVVISNDISQCEFLIPLPQNALLQVADNAPIVPAIESALRLYEEEPAIVDASREELEHWLDHGCYSRRRPDLWDRFQNELRAA